VKPPPSKVPRRVEVYRVNEDRSVFAWVDGNLETVPLERLERWLNAGTLIQPSGGWQ